MQGKCNDKHANVKQVQRILNKHNDRHTQLGTEQKQRTQQKKRPAEWPAENK